MAGDVLSYDTTWRVWSVSATLRVAAWGTRCGETVLYTARNIARDTRRHVP